MSITRTRSVVSIPCILDTRFRIYLHAKRPLIAVVGIVLEFPGDFVDGDFELPLLPLLLKVLLLGVEEVVEVEGMLEAVPLRG